MTATAVAAAGVTGWIAWTIWQPSEDVPAVANAVVVFAGGKGERLVRAQELMDAGVAPVLVLNTGTDRWNPEAFDAQVAVCDDPGVAYEVICVSGDSTKTEAEAFTTVARARAWTSMVALTDDYHLARSSRWLGRCFDGTVYRAAAIGEPGLGIRLREMAATVQMMTTDRSCPAAE